MATKEEEQFKEMFNAGYLMQQHEPELLDQILKKDNQHSELVKGLVSGKQQYQREKIIKEQQEIKRTQKQAKPKR